MNSELMLGIDHESLGKILEALLGYEEVQASPQLIERIQTALKFHQSLGKELQKFFADYDIMARTVLEKTEDPRVKIHGEFRKDLLGAYDKLVYSRYDNLYKAGADPTLMCRVATLENYNRIERIKLLRGYYGLSLQDAKAIVASVDAENEKEQT